MFRDLRENNWSVVVSMNPKGYAHIRRRDREVYGPVDHMEITTNGNVRIWTKWTKSRPLNSTKGTWQEERGYLFIIDEFVNRVVPFSIEETSNNGQRIAFNDGSFIYLEERSLQIDLNTIPRLAG